MLYEGRATNTMRRRPTCDLCSDRAVADAKTIHGPWAFMCPLHYLEHADGLGMGRGQYLLCGDDLDAGLITLLTRETAS